MYRCDNQLICRLTLSDGQAFHTLITSYKYTRPCEAEELASQTEHLQSAA